jgi:hypothetical protein
MLEPVEYDPVDEEIHRLEQELQIIIQCIQTITTRNTILRTEIQCLEKQLRSTWL